MRFSNSNFQVKYTYSPRVLGMRARDCGGARGAVGAVLNMRAVPAVRGVQDRRPGLPGQRVHSSSLALSLAVSLSLSLSL